MRDARITRNMGEEMGPCYPGLWWPGAGTTADWSGEPSSRGSQGIHSWQMADVPGRRGAGLMVHFFTIHSICDPLFFLALPFTLSLRFCSFPCLWSPLSLPFSWSSVSSLVSCLSVSLPLVSPHLLISPSSCLIRNP